MGGSAWGGFAWGGCAEDRGGVTDCCEEPETGAVDCGVVRSLVDSCMGRSAIKKPSTL